MVWLGLPMSSFSPIERKGCCGTKRRAAAHMNFAEPAVKKEQRISRMKTSPDGLAGENDLSPVCQIKGLAGKTISKS